MTMTADQTDAPHEAVAAPREMRVIDAAELFKGRREIAIAHGGAIYRLKITRQGKLILNK